MLQVKEESGWSIPLVIKGKDTKEAYAKAILELYQYFEHPNKELYRMMEALGPESGWQGTFAPAKAE